MKIAQISYHACPLAYEEGKETGGMQTYVFNLSRELARLGHKVDVFTRSEDARAKKIVEVIPGFRVIHLKAGPEKTLPKKEIVRFIPNFAKELSNYVGADHGQPLGTPWRAPTKKSAQSYDIIHAHYYMSGIVVTQLFQQLTINKQPASTAGGQTTKSNPSSLQTTDYRLPTVLSFHTLAILKNLVARSLQEQESEERIQAELDLCQKTDLIIAPSTLDTAYLKYFYDAPETKIKIIPPGYDAQIFRPMEKAAARAHIGADPQHKIILFVGRIEPLKGIDNLMLAMKILTKRCPDCKICLWVIGGNSNIHVKTSHQLSSRLRPTSGASSLQNQRQTPREMNYLSHGASLQNDNSELSRLHKLHDTLGLSGAIKFIPQLPQHELPWFYNAADVVVMPSHYESFGMSALEAAACGTPVVVSNVAGIANTLKEHGKNIVISAHSPLMLAGAIEKLLNSNPQIPPQDLSDLSWENMAKNMEKIYQRIFANH